MGLIGSGFLTLCAMRDSEQLRQEGVVHVEYAGDRQQSVEDLRADPNHALTGMLHQGVGGVRGVDAREKIRGDGKIRLLAA